MNGLIVVDAWRNCERLDLDLYPYLEKETKLYGQYINHLLTLINFKIKKVL